MREIKFKAQKSHNNEIVYFDLKYFLENDGGRIPDEMQYTLKNIRQFIGRKDKESRDIYDGDFDNNGNCVSWCENCNGWEFSAIDIPTKDVCIPCYRCDCNFFFEDLISDFKIFGSI